jgi:hypothetical protein
MYHNINNTLNNNMNSVSTPDANVGNESPYYHLTDYLNSISESRRVMSSMIETLNRQENNIYNMFLRGDTRTARTYNRGGQQTAYRTSPVSRWWSQQPNFPPRTNRFNYDILRGMFNTNNLEPVIVRPSRTQILNSTSVISIRDIPLSQRFYNVCPISYETFTEDTVVTRINECGHYFDTNSINEWFNRNVRCPVCRYDIRNISEDSTQRVNRQEQTSDMSTSDISTSDISGTDTTSMHSSNTPTRSAQSTTTSTTSTTSTTTSSRTTANNRTTNQPLVSTLYSSGTTDSDIIDTLFSNLQQYMSNNPAVLHFEYGIVPVDASGNILETDE